MKTLSHCSWVLPVPVGHTPVTQQGKNSFFWIRVGENSQIRTACPFSLTQVSSTALGDRDLWKPGKFYPVKGDKENFLAISADLMKNTEEVSRGGGGPGRVLFYHDTPEDFLGISELFKMSTGPWRVPSCDAEVWRR